MNKTINVSLPEDLVQLAKEHVANGYYASISDVIRDALRHSLLSSIPGETKVKERPNTPKNS